jgi:ABC-type Mn2+/Zn2+ transport system ATPase subunit
MAVWIHRHRISLAGVGALLSATTISRRRSLKRAQAGRSWLAALPVRAAIAQWESVAIEAAPVLWAIGALAAAFDADLLHLADELQFLPYLESFVDTLSLGTRQKLSVLLSLVGDSRLIVLDEAFNGLDPASALIVKRHLRHRLEGYGAALLLATHSLDIVEHYADRAALLMGSLWRER